MLDVNPGDIITYQKIDHWPITVKVLTVSKNRETAFVDHHPHNLRKKAFSIEMAVLQQGVQNESC